MSLVTRRSASARWSWWATTAAEAAARTMLPTAVAATWSRSRSALRQSARASCRTTSRSTPHGRPSPGMAQRDLAAAEVRDRGPRRASISTTAPDRSERVAEHAERARDLDEGGEPVGAGNRRGRESVAVEAPRRGLDGAERLVDRRGPPPRAGRRGSRARRGSPSRSAPSSSPTRSSMAWWSSSGDDVAGRRARRRPCAADPCDPVGRVGAAAGRRNRGRRGTAGGRRGGSADHRAG